MEYAKYDYTFLHRTLRPFKSLGMSTLLLTSIPNPSLGKSGLKISKIVLGAMSFGSSEWQPWVLDEEDALPLLKHAYDRGINTWDTADVYSNGASETIIANAIAHYQIPRSSLVLLTKVYFGVADSGQPPISAMGTNDGIMVNRVGLSRKHILDAVEASVARLGTYIDVLQVHRLDRDVPREEVMRALNDVVERGWVRYLGASSVSLCSYSCHALRALEMRDGEE
jgi:aryl-alcohol dehydrogenase-like predicted oxidoreductase